MREFRIATHWLCLPTDELAATSAPRSIWYRNWAGYGDTVSPYSAKRSGTDHAWCPPWPVRSMPGVKLTNGGKKAYSGSVSSSAGGLRLTAKIAAAGDFPTKREKGAKLSCMPLVRTSKAPQRSSAMWVVAAFPMAVPRRGRYAGSRGSPGASRPRPPGRGAPAAARVKSREGSQPRAPGGGDAAAVLHAGPRSQPRAPAGGLTDGMASATVCWCSARRVSASAGWMVIRVGGAGIGRRR